MVRIGHTLLAFGICALIGPQHSHSAPDPKEILEEKRPRSAPEVIRFLMKEIGGVIVPGQMSSHIDENGNAEYHLEWCTPGAPPLSLHVDAYTGLIVSFEELKDEKTEALCRCLIEKDCADFHRDYEAGRY